MSQSTLSQPVSRRSVLAGTAATATTAAAVMTFGLPGSASAAASAAVGSAGSNSALCAAHHKELSQHLAGILNAGYVEERMKNKVLSTAHCPHCKVAISPDMKSRAAFSALA